jgi:ABC-type transporter Mla MlaB component
VSTERRHLDLLALTQDSLACVPLIRMDDIGNAQAKLIGAVTLTSLERQRAFLAKQSDVEVLDLAGVTDLDTAGAWAIASFQLAQKAKGREITIANATEAQALLLQTVTDALPPRARRRRRLPLHEAGDMLVELGKAVSSLPPEWANPSASSDLFSHGLRPRFCIRPACG